MFAVFQSLFQNFNNALTDSTNFIPLRKETQKLLTNPSNVREHMHMYTDFSIKNQKRFVINLFENSFETNKILFFKELLDLDWQILSVPFTRIFSHFPIDITHIIFNYTQSYQEDHYIKENCNDQFKYSRFISWTKSISNDDINDDFKINDHIKIIKYSDNSYTFEYDTYCIHFQLEIYSYLFKNKTIEYSHTLMENGPDFIVENWKEHNLSKFSICDRTN